jgi:flagellar hook-associated protein 2
VQYRVNGSATEVFSNSRKVDLSPGLTVNLLKSGGGPVNITVANNTSGLRGSLSNLVSAYNASVDALNQNRGDKGGALTGNSLVFSLTNILRSFPQYRQSSTSGGVRSLADLGVTLDQAGHLSLDSTVFSNINPALIQNFLGGLDKNGFVKSSTSSLNTVIDVTTGLLPTDLDSVRSRIAKNNAQLTEQQTRIDKLQENLQAQLSKADAVIANLQSQKTYFANLFQAQYGKAGQ